MRTAITIKRKRSTQQGFWSENLDSIVQESAHFFVFMQANSKYAIRCGKYAIGNGVTFGEAYALLVYSLKTWVQSHIQ